VPLVGGRLAISYDSDFMFAFFFFDACISRGCLE